MALPKIRPPSYCSFLEQTNSPTLSVAFHFRAKSSSASGSRKGGDSSENDDSGTRAELGALERSSPFKAASPVWRRTPREEGSFSRR